MHLKGEDKKGDDDKQRMISYSDNYVRFLELETEKRWEFVKQCCGLALAEELEWSSELIREDNDKKGEGDS